MPTTFSAATCLTSSFVSDGTFNIYLTDDYTSTPFSSVTKNQLTINCPFIFTNIPAGTTTFYVKNVESLYCFTIPIRDNNICQTCNLGLSNYSATTITRLSCGFLTGSCQNITDYVIHWYGPNDTTTLEMRTGFGSVFSGEYDIPHPFLGTSAIPLTEGVYTPIIQKVIVSGLTFSNTGGTNSILFDGNCLPTTTIQPLTCSNRTNTKTEYWASGYNHNIIFSSQSQGAPQPVSSTYVLSPTTKFIAWKFQGKSIPDTIKLSFRGSGYVDDIGLENWVIGTSGNTHAYTPSLISKSAVTLSYFTKITCLTGLTRNTGDKIIIDVIPAESNTDWDLLITCLDSFNCNSCAYTNPYKIIGSTITGITDNCKLEVNFTVSGCSPNTLFNEDYFKYYDTTELNGISTLFQDAQRILSPQQFGGSFNNIKYADVNGGLPYNSADFYYNSKVCNYDFRYTENLLTSCKTDPNDITYKKTFLTDGSNRGVFSITGSSTVISTFYNSWITAINLSNSLGYSPNNTNLGYYRYFGWYFPKTNHPNNCGDQSGKNSAIIHPSSTVLTGTTSSGDYFFNLTANTITTGYTISTCDIDCVSRISGLVSSVNISSTGNSGFNQYFSANTSFGWYGIYYDPPFEFLYYVTAPTTTFSAQTIGERIYTNNWSTSTYPYSGTSPSIIPSLSGSVCNFNNFGSQVSWQGGFYNDSILCQYTTLYPNSADTSSFEIWATPIINYVPTPPDVLAYRFSGGTVTTSNPTYII
jgi:hypothetical protein